MKISGHFPNEKFLTKNGLLWWFLHKTLSYIYLFIFGHFFDDLDKICLFYSKNLKLMKSWKMMSNLVHWTFKFSCIHLNVFLFQFRKWKALKVFILAFEILGFHVRKFWKKRIFVKKYFWQNENYSHQKCWF